MKKYCCKKFEELREHDNVLRAKWDNDSIVGYFLLVGYWYSEYPDDPGYGTEGYDELKISYCPFCGSKIGQVR